MIWIAGSPAGENGRALAGGPLRPIAVGRAPALLTTDGCPEMTNNAERAIRPLALGRKNWLFAGSDTGGERAAMIYTILETAKLNGLDPYRYLANVLGRIAGHPINRIAELLPWIWQQAQAAAQAA